MKEGAGNNQVPSNPANRPGCSRARGTWDDFVVLHLIICRFPWVAMLGRDGVYSG